MSRPLPPRRVVAGLAAGLVACLAPLPVLAQGLQDEPPEVIFEEPLLEETQREVPTWDEDRPPALTLPPAAEAGNLQRDTAVLRWLDKMTARVRTIEVRVNETTNINTLEFIVRACLERPPEEPPESAAFLDVWERKPGEPVSEVFRGWMFASSPAVSAMEHPVYDLWVLSCEDGGGEPPAAAGTE
ncbi:DUF2155 domain-containing protein [Novispirillum sp. DQ9]|uniref:DUF2155 domain-containing protein n=1 Tax=Novispirillum sp. DQ9 TaxID=3398612 RepID=UPI003C79870A